MRVMACHRYKREDRNARTKLTRGPPYTARDEVNMNLMGCPVCWPWFRAASRTVRTESTFTYSHIDQCVVIQTRAVCSNLDSEVEIVFRSARHDSMETVYGVVHAVLSIEESVGLCRVCQVRLDCDSIRTWRSFGLDYVDKNQTKAR